jgi:hypothetical protein
MDDILKSIGQYGFPMVVSIYLLIRFESKIDSLTMSIESMNTIISKLKL